MHLKGIMMDLTEILFSSVQFHNTEAVTADIIISI